MQSGRTSPTLIGNAWPMWSRTKYLLINLAEPSCHKDAVRRMTLIIIMIFNGYEIERGVSQAALESRQYPQIILQGIILTHMSPVNHSSTVRPIHRDTTTLSED